jgi:hypothetical protein
MTFCMFNFRTKVDAVVDSEFRWQLGWWTSISGCGLPVDLCRYVQLLSRTPRFGVDWNIDQISSIITRVLLPMPISSLDLSVSINKQAVAVRRFTKWLYHRILVLFTRNNNCVRAV